MMAEVMATGDDDEGSFFTSFYCVAMIDESKYFTSIIRPVKNHIRYKWVIISRHKKAVKILRSKKYNFNSFY